MAGIKGRSPFLCGHRIGIPLAGHDAGHHLGADAVDRRLIEAWFLNGEPEQVEGLVLAVREHAHGAVDAVACLPEPHLGPSIVQPGLERLAIEVAGAFVEQPGHQVGQPLLAGRVLRTTTVESELDVDDRHRIVFDQPR